MHGSVTERVTPLTDPLSEAAYSYRMLAIRRRYGLNITT